MRITFNMLSMKYMSNIENSLNRVSTANDKVTKQRNLVAPETDPVNYISAINIQRTIDEADQFKRNAESALTWITNEDNELQNAFDLISRAKNEYAVAGASDSQNATSRAALAGDVANILDSMVEIGNAKYMGKYIFAGYQTQTAPFASEAREITSVRVSVPDTDIIKKNVFADMPELDKGIYRILISKDSSNMVTVSVSDSKGDAVFVDSNGADESALSGNRSALSVTSKYVPGGVVNTGLGFGVKLPENDFAVIDAEFYFNPGSDVKYHGDEGSINTKIGYTQDVPLNFNGKEIFLDTNRVVKGTKLNTVNGLPITAATKFSQIEGTNSSLADYITISGTDHNGYKVGTAQILSPDNINLDLSTSTLEDRTLKLTYTDREYELVVDKQAYKNIDDMIFNINRKLEDLDLETEIEASSDGDRILFSTTKAGNGVRLSVEGSLNSRLGFGTNPVSASGSDTTFEFYYDSFDTSLYNTLTVSSSPTMDISINGNEFTVNITDKNSSGAGIDSEDVRLSIDEALQANGLYSTISTEVTSAAGTFDITFGLHNVNFGNDTYLNTSVTIGGTTVREYSNPRQLNYPFDTEKRVGDFLEFIEKAYGYTVNAEVKDGYVQVTDLRSGESSFSIKMNESNTGVGYPMADYGVTLLGSYDGGRDAEWNVQLTNETATTIDLVVTDNFGNTLVNRTNIQKSDIENEPLDLIYGVSMMLDNSSPRSFSVELKGEPSLSFGDMNIIKDGTNVDVFRSLKNLKEALELDIPSAGISAPSAWRDENLESTANPYLSGTFRGNYNDKWSYEIETGAEQTKFFVQEELTAQTKSMSIALPVNLDFNISIYNKTDSALPYESININGSFASVDEIADAINASSIKNYGGRAENVDGKLVVYSGSGIYEVGLETNDADTDAVMGINNSPVTALTPRSFDFTSASASERTINVRYYDSVTMSWAAKDIQLSAGNFTDMNGLNTEINNQLTAAGIGITSSVNVSNIEFYSASTNISNISLVWNSTYNQNQNSVTAKNSAELDLSNKTADEASITLRYNDGVNWLTKSIQLESKKYSSSKEMVDAINSQLTGLNIEAVNDDGKINFIYYDDGVSSVNSLIVSGDATGTLGYLESGDEAVIKISNKDGDIVNRIKVNTANVDSYVADGVFLAFDKGSLKSSDVFTHTVGSGVSYEIPVLDKAETQVNEKVTVVGTRQNRVDAVINFHDTLTTSAETIKATYLGSSEIDTAKALTEYQLAQQVYEASLSVASKTMKLSILDYL